MTTCRASITATESDLTLRIIPSFDQHPETSLFTAVSASCLLGLSYVLSLYIWSLPFHSPSGKSYTFLQDRDHPSTIKRRFISAFCMLFVSPPFVLAFGTHSLLDAPGAALFSVIGFRGEGLLSAVNITSTFTAYIVNESKLWQYVEKVCNKDVP